jgi:hypothetical protein
MQARDAAQGEEIAQGIQDAASAGSFACILSFASFTMQIGP